MGARDACSHLPFTPPIHTSHSRLPFTYVNLQSKHCSPCRLWPYGFVWARARDDDSRLPFTPLVHTFRAHLLFSSRAYSAARAVGSETLQSMSTVALFGWEPGAIYLIHTYWSLRCGHPPGRGWWHAPSSRHLRAL